MSTKHPSIHIDKKDKISVAKALRKQKFESDKILEVSLFFVTPNGKILYKEQYCPVNKRIVKKIFINIRITHNNLHKYLVKKIDKAINRCLWEPPKEVYFLKTIESNKFRRFVFIVVCNRNNTFRYYNGARVATVYKLKNFTSIRQFGEINEILRSFAIDLPKIYAKIVWRRRKIEKQNILQFIEYYDETLRVRQERRTKRIEKLNRLRNKQKLSEEV